MRQIVNIYNLIDALAIHIELQELREIGLTEDEIAGGLEVMIQNWLERNVEQTNQSNIPTLFDFRVQNYLH